MMRFVQILALANALLQSDGEGHLRNAATKKEDQVSFADGMSNSFADVDAKLKAMEAKTSAELAKLQSDTAAPSSFVEEGAPDSFADLDAKLKALEEKTKAELAKLQSDTAAPSSFVEEGAPDSFADLDAKLKALQEKTKAELAKLQSDTAAPSSFVEEGAMPGSLVELTAHLAALKQDTDTELQQLSEGKITPSSFVENMKKRTKKLQALHTLAMDMPVEQMPSSLAEEEDELAPFAELNSDMKNMEEKLKADAKHAKSIGQNSKIKLLSDVLSEKEKEQKDQ